MSHHSQLLHIALDTPVLDYFDYLCPNTFDLPCVGTRVQVPFGSRTLVGVVVGIAADSDTPRHKLKPIIEIIDKTPILTTTTLILAHWLSRYYHYPLGETLAVMLPSAIRQGKVFEQYHWQILKPADFHKPTKQSMAYQALQGFEHGASSRQLKQLGIDGSTLNALAKKQLIAHLPTTPKPPPIATLKESPLALSDEQQQAVNAISHQLKQGTYGGFLLDGVTGSGKTEVYLQAIYEVLQQGKQVLVLVPEIGLTPQTYERFAKRFCANILVLHSNISHGERGAGFMACLNATAQIIIATRSACLYPFANLGLIIVDEAHDSSYKQQDHLRYHACDVALYLGHLSQIPVILGSATPSLEHYHLCQIGKLTKLRLSTRINATAPRYYLMDKRQGVHYHQNHQGQARTSELTTQTVWQIRSKLDKGEQVLIFLNRRGYAPILLCQACGYQADCVRCSSHLTLHKYPKTLLKCHHCGFETPTPKHCPDCGSGNLDTIGQGTSQLYEHLHALFANPQTSKKVYPILQIDKDTTNKKHDWDRIYAQVLTGEPMILVGTQMLAKGHHFPKVTLVVVVDADTGFLSPNFRAFEHTSQQIIQVAGRAGRADHAGDVIIQTLKPDLPLLHTLTHQGYDELATQLLKERQLLALPPYTYSALLQAESTHQKSAQDCIIFAKNSLPNNHPLAVLAPINAPLAKKNNRYVVHMVMLAKTRQDLHHTIGTWWQSLKSTKPKNVRLSLDIDPIGW